MLRAPELKTTSQPFDPNLQAILAPSQKEHPTQPATPTNTPNETETLNLALIKNAVTTLHQEDETQFAALSQYTGPQIAELTDDHAKFLKNQKNKYNQSLKTNRQKHLFETMTAPFFTQSLNRAKTLQHQKTRQFHEETVESQNREFLNRALAPENALDDNAQTAYRNMILFNLENLHNDKPETEQKTLLDNAAKTIYTKIIEKRLEIDPDAATPLLDAATIQRTLGDNAIRQYRQQATQLKKDKELRRAAAALLDAGLPPSQAKTRAKHNHPEDAKTVIEHYTDLRYNENRKLCLTNILNFDSVWRELAENNFNRNHIPAWVKNNATELHAAILDNLAARDQNGGLPPEPDYALLVDFAQKYEPRAAAERFHREGELYSFITRLGGPDSPAFQTALRLMLGKSTPADKAWIADLALAGEEFARRAGDAQPDREWLQDNLARFNNARRIRLDREKITELDEAEVRALMDLK